MQSKLMSNPEQPSGADDSIAKISGDTVEIFGQRFPLRRPHYFKPTGELESFAVAPTIINFNGREIPIGLRISLHKDGRFHGSSICKGYTYEHKGQTFQLAGASGLCFYPNKDLERLTVENKTETNFIVDGKPLVLYKWDTIAFYENSGLPKKVWRRYDEIFQEEYYNMLEISETGEITDRIYEKRPDYDYD
jgi:hypothetical protein